MTERFPRILFTAIILVFFAAVAWLRFAAPINLATADVGRHIRNGEQILAMGRILSTNFYSYTHPDFPAPCHHWGIGIIFYLIWKAWGFMGLSWMYTGLLFMTFILAVFQARRASYGGLALLMGVLALPLLGYRTEIRPEGVSTFFLAAEFFLLDAFWSGRLRARWLVFLPFLHLLWVNIHIMFLCGLLLVVCYALAALVTDGWSRRARVLVAAGGGTFLGSLATPFLFSGLFQPATLFQGYGYRLAENMNVFFMMKRFPGRVIYGYYLAALIVTVVLVIARMVREKNWKPALPHALIVVLFGAMGVAAVRCIAMAGFFFIPIAAASAGVLVSASRFWRRIIVAAAAALIALAAVVPYFYLSPLREFRGTAPDPSGNALFYVLAHPTVWGGLAPGVEQSARFLQQTGFKGPVFNNYDIGGYFIFYFFPKERPFVDNRPEAYPEDFFRSIYGPMQMDDGIWAQMQKRYGFELIYFYRHDMTDWGQPFLIRRLSDPAWAPVYVDAYMIIFARRGGKNQSLIDHYQLPKEMFKVTHN